jgi:hypothetical protein
VLAATVDRVVARLGFLLREKKQGEVVRTTAIEWNQKRSGETMLAEATTWNLCSFIVSCLFFGAGSGLCRHFGAFLHVGTLHIVPLLGFPPPGKHFEHSMLLFYPLRTVFVQCSAVHAQNNSSIMTALGLLAPSAHLTIRSIMSIGPTKNEDHNVDQSHHERGPRTKVSCKQLRLLSVSLPPSTPHKCISNLDSNFDSDVGTL